MDNGTFCLKPNYTIIAYEEVKLGLHLSQQKIVVHYKDGSMLNLLNGLILLYIKFPANLGLCHFCKLDKLNIKGIYYLQVLALVKIISI